MADLRVLRSEVDASVNLVEERLAGFLEARYVRRCADYFVAYLSSHNGCNRGCAMCHLTATRQTSFQPADSDDYVAQASRVFDEYDAAVAAGAPPARWMHYAFMARGEPLSNPAIVGSSRRTLGKLLDLAEERTGLPVKLCVSTIMPKTLQRSLIDVFEYQRFTKKIVKIHFAFIRGENDAEADVVAMCDRLDDHDIVAEFNLVRYNPASPAQGQESDEATLRRNLDIIGSRFAGRVKMVERIGFSIKASCGMFVER